MELFFICPEKVQSVEPCFEWKEKQSNNKWIFSVLVLCRPSLILVFSMVSPFLSLRIQEPTKEYLKDHLILLDFVGYYLCKLIVHHCLRRACRVRHSVKPSRDDEEIEIFLIWWKDYRVVNDCGERNRWSAEISTIFVSFHRRNQQQFLHWRIGRRKSKKEFPGLSQFIWEEWKFRVDKYFPSFLAWSAHTCRPLLRWILSDVSWKVAEIERKEIFHSHVSGKN